MFRRKCYLDVLADDWLPTAELLQTYRLRAAGNETINQGPGKNGVSDDSTQTIGGGWQSVRRDAHIFRADQNFDLVA